LTITALPNTKTFDGSTSAAATPTVTGLQGGSDTVTGLSETYDTSAVGSNKTLSVAAGYTVSDGNLGGNYNVNTVANTNGVINSATAVSTTTSLTTSSGTVVYGTTVTFTAIVSANTGSVAPTQGNVDFKDTTTNTDFLNGTFVSSSGTSSTWTFTTGIKTFNFTTGDTIVATYSGDAAFNGSNGSTTQIVNKAPLTITALANSKTYDGTTSAAATPTVAGLVTGDTVTGLSETYNSKNAGTGKTLSVAAGYTVSDGNSGGNYTVTTASSTAGVINKATLTITALANTKTFDNTTSAAATPTVVGLVGGDTVTGLSETYDTSAVGTGKTLTVSPGYVVNDGNSGGNYTVTTATSKAGVINSATSTSSDLTIAETSSKTVVAGHDVVYTITLKNLGPGAAQGVVVSDLLAPNVTYVSGLGPAGFNAPTLVGGTVTFTANQDLAVGASGPSATFTIVARVSSTAGSNTWVSNTATVSGNNLTTNSVTVTAQVNVAGASLVGSSLSNGKQDLVVTGTAGPDSIFVLPTCGNKLLVIEDGRVFGPFAAPTGRIVVYSGNGNDMVYASPVLTEQSWIFGGAGNDVFYADGGNSVLVGGSGSNMLFSGQGYNILIGGGGGSLNYIMGTKGNNIEISGSTCYNANQAALNAILQEWASGGSYSVRVQKITQTGLSVNGSTVKLNSSTIQQAAACEFLFGGTGQNLFFARQTGSMVDGDFVMDFVIGRKTTGPNAEMELRN
jgi:hypothetical protein